MRHEFFACENNSKYSIYADEQEGMTGDGLNNMNGLNDLNGVNDINNMNGIDGIDGMDAIDAMEGIEGMDGMDGMEGMEGMEDVNMNGIDDLFGNDWDSKCSSSFCWRKRRTRNKINSFLLYLIQYPPPMIYHCQRTIQQLQHSNQRLKPMTH